GRGPPASRSQSPPGGRIEASERVGSCRASSASAAPLTHENINVKHEINSAYRESVSCAQRCWKTRICPAPVPKDKTFDEFFRHAGTSNSAEENVNGQLLDELLAMRGAIQTCAHIFSKQGNFTGSMRTRCSRSTKKMPSDSPKLSTDMAGLASR